MKRKLLTLLAILATSCCFAFGFSACDTLQNETSSSNETSIEESSSEETESIGLQYTLSEDETYYIVSGIGTCKDTEIFIPSIYKNLPVTSIGDSAFKDYKSLTSITIPNSVTEIGFGAFAYCSNLTNVEIGNSVAKIGHGAFWGCSSFTNIDIPDSVTFIGVEAFSHCTGLTSVVFPDSVTSIDEGAFNYCSNLISVKIPNSVISIGNYAFYNCSSLTTVYYNGTAEQWNALQANIGESNTYLTNATIYYYVENEADVPTDGGKYWHYVNGVPTKWN